MKSKAVIDPARCAAAVLLALIVSGCAGNRVVSRAPEAIEAAQSQRQQAVAAIRNFSFAGRVAVSNGHDGGSAQIEWQQEGARADITLRAPVTGQTWRLVGDDGNGWQLQGTRAGGAQGDDAESLLLRETGWRLPFAALRQWLFGLAHASGDRVELRDNGLPARLTSADGWIVEYVNYDETRTPPLATRLRADLPPHKVRLAISKWNIQ